MTYDEYQSLGGQSSEAEFTSLLPLVNDFLQSYAESYIASWKQEDSLSAYGEFDKATVYQIDFISANGGLKVFHGASDLDIDSVTTSGYTFKTGNDVDRFNGIPISPLAKSLILKELMKNGYLNKVIA